jgi:RHS repeat-associated protein
LKVFLISLLSLFVGISVHPSVSEAQSAPDVLFSVSLKKNGSYVGTYDPATSWSYSTTSSGTNYSLSGSVSSGTLSGAYSIDFDGSHGFLSRNEGYEIQVWVRNGATATTEITTAATVSVDTSSSHRTSAHVSPPWGQSTIEAEVNQGGGGTDSASDSLNASNFERLTCATGASNGGCTTFAAYPGVSYCRPPSGTAITLGAGLRHDGTSSQTLDLSSSGTLSISVTIGQDDPVVVFSDLHVGGNPVTEAEVDDTVTVYNDSYDPDEQLGTNTREGICSASWVVTHPDGTTTTGSNIYSISFDAESPGLYEVELTVTDNEGVTKSDVLDVVVAPREPAPGDGLTNDEKIHYSCGSSGPSTGPGPDGTPNLSSALQDVGGFVSIGSGNNHAYIHDPVDTRGLGLSTRIHINSQTRFPTRTTNMGNASFTYAMEVRVGAASDQTLHWWVIDADGEELDFGPTSSAPTPGTLIFSQLSAITGGWKLEDAGPPESVDAAGNYTYEFDSNGKLVEIVDPAGNIQELTYDLNGDLEEVEDLSTGRVITYEYDTPGYIARIVEAGGDAVHHLSYTSNRLSGSVLKDSIGTTIREVAFTYNGDGLLSKIRRDQDSGTDIDFTYKHMGNDLYVANFADQEGFDSDLDYTDGSSNVSGGLYRITRSNVHGGFVAYHYSPEMQLLKRSVPPHNGTGFWTVYQYTYHSSGLLATSTNGATTVSYTYNSLGLPTQIATTGDRTLTFTYSGSDLLTAADQDGTFLTQTYTDTNNPHSPTTIADAGGNTWTLTYNTYGQVTQIAPPSGSATGTVSLTYEENSADDDYGYLRTIVDGEGDSVDFDSYSAFGDVTSLTTSPTIGVTHTTTFEYDPARRLTELEFPNGKTLQNSYVGYFLDESLDENSESTEFEFCKGCGKPKSISAPLSKVLEWAYTGDRQLSVFTDARGNDTEYTYGQAGEIEEQEYPDSHSFTYTYDRYGRLDRRTDSRSAYQDFSDRDSAGRVETIAYSNPWRQSTEFEYHYDGRLKKMKDEAGITTYTYDSSRRLSKASTDFTRSGLTRVQDVEYTYYPDGLIDTITWKDNGTTVTSWSYSYDGAGRIEDVTNGFGETTDYVYDGEGKLLSQTNNNGTSTTLSYYEPRGWVDEIDHKDGATSFETYELTYDSSANTVGNITGITELDGSTVSYGYDSLYRLTSEARTTTNTLSNTFAYDLADNVTTVNSTTFATYDTANKFATVPGGSASYDGIGNLTAVSGTGLTTASYTWGPVGELRSQTVGASTTDYEYNGNNFRVFKDPGGSSSNRRWYVFAGSTLIGEVSPSGATVAYTHGGNGLVSSRILSSSDSYFYHFGPQGETRYLTDDTGAVTDTYYYDAYGQTIASTGSTFNPFKYGGQYGYYTEGPSDIMLATWRWYSPQLLRWLNRDPILYAGGDNVYVYVGGNPTNNIDPTGLEECERTASIWVCSRPVSAFYGPYIPNHLFVCCKGPLDTCCGHAHNNYKKGERIDPDPNPQGDCQERKVCESEKEAKCDNPKSPCNADTFHWNCRDWSNWNGRSACPNYPFLPNVPIWR